MTDFAEALARAETFAREHPEIFERLGKDALPLIGKLLLGKFGDVQVEYDRRHKAESVAAARALIREAREEGADVDAFLGDLAHLAGLLLRSSVKALI
ncbi:MAG: hypothetical protein IT345_08700 [Trueperaceae bacterium]|nr:hypothetical protein [Trueperaceae bacterium]